MKDAKDCLSKKEYQNGICFGDDIVDRFSNRYINFQGFSICKFQKTSSSCKVCKGYSNFENGLEICIGTTLNGMEPYTLVYRIIKNIRLEDSLFEI